MTYVKQDVRCTAMAALAVSLCVSTLARAAAADWVDFSPPGGGHLPVRFYQGQVECASTNGKDCQWGVSASDLPSDASKLKPLSCGANHKAKWGTDGYSAPNHWCSTAYSRLYATWAWGSSVYYSVTPVSVSTTGEVVGGDVQCLSNDNYGCMWGTNTGNEPANEFSIAKPLVCGTMHADKWGVTGYSDPSHWCSVLGAQYQVPTTVPYVNPADCLSLSWEVPSWSAAPSWLLRSTGNCTSAGVPLYIEGKFPRGIGEAITITPPLTSNFFMGLGGDPVAITATEFLLPAPIAANYTGQVGDFYVDMSTGIPYVFQQVAQRTPGDGSTLPTAGQESNAWFDSLGPCLKSSCATVEARPYIAPPQVVTPALNAGFMIGPATVTRGQFTALTVFLNRTDFSNNKVSIALALPPGVTASTDGPTGACTTPESNAVTTAAMTATWNAALPQPTAALTLPNASQCTISWMLNVTAAAQTGRPLVAMTATTTGGTRQFTLPINIR